MADIATTGTILQGIGGFYTALDDEGREYTLRAQGKLRREHMKPKVGDRVEMMPGEGEEHGWICRILPRRNALVRPPVANIDVIVIVAAAATPDPDLLMVDRLMLNARRAGISVYLLQRLSFCRNLFRHIRGSCACSHSHMQRADTVQL